jgi:accessory gene regulator B
MKKFIISKCMNYIEKNTSYNKIKLAEIKYGLEGVYLTVTKMIVIFSLAIILGIFKEMFIYMIIYNLIRMPSFGLHATKSWICLLSSTILFIGIPYLCICLNIPLIIKIIITIAGTLLMIKNSPADTKKRPIVNKTRRLIYKIISSVLTLIFGILSIYVKNNFISNCFAFSIIMQNCLISPIVYKIFKLPYNNYITFLKEHPDFSN